MTDEVNYVGKDNIPSRDTETGEAMYQRYIQADEPWIVERLDCGNPDALALARSKGYFTWPKPGGAVGQSV